MKTEYNFNNAENLLFHSFNQRKHKKYYYCCAVFAPIINITMNCKRTHNIDFTRNDIDVICDRMEKAWKLIRYKNEKWFAWAEWLDWINYTYSYLKEQVAKWRKSSSWKKWKTPNLSTYYDDDDEKLKKQRDCWYVYIFWMWVNKDFVEDMIDWKLERFEDYKNYKWDKLKHFTNWAIWQRSKEKYWEEFICDSYAHNKHWFERIYWNFNLKEALEDILFRSKYIFH